jgi:hypothetical protein
MQTDPPGREQPFSEVQSMAHSTVRLVLVLSLFLPPVTMPSFVPSLPEASACVGPGCHAGVAVGVRVGVRFRRPFCGPGPVHPGCVAPLRKFARGVGRVGGAVLRGAGRVAVGAARVVGAGLRGIGRALFGRCRLCA